MGQRLSSGSKLRGRYLHELRVKVPRMNLDEIVEWYQGYRKVCKNKSKMRINEFKNVYRELFQEDSAELAEHIFRAFDTNNDGKVDFEEFLVGLSVTDLTQPADKDERVRKLRWAFRVYDVDRNGTISRDEMRKIVQSVFYLTEMPTRTTDTPEEFADRLFGTVDVDGDGEITFEEFQLAAESSNTLLELLFPQQDSNSFL